MASIIQSYLSCSLNHVALLMKIILHMCANLEVRWQAICVRIMWIWYN